MERALLTFFDEGLPLSVRHIPRGVPVVDALSRRGLVALHVRHDP